MSTVMGEERVRERTARERDRARSAAAEAASPGARRPMPGRTRSEAESLANFLGWFSIGLGAAELLAPRGVAEVIGVRPTLRNRAVLRAMGIREMAKGIGILSEPRPTGWLWARVAGDALDLGLLGRAFARSSHRPVRTLLAMGSVLGVAALDTACAQALSSGQRYTRHRTADGRGIRLRQSVTINRSPEEAYRFWRDLENLPRFMRHLEEVRVTGERRSHWKARAPAGLSVEWEAETVEDRPNELIAWRSLEGSTIRNSGSVRFRPVPGGRGTMVSVELEYGPPGGIAAAAFARLFGEEPGQQLEDDLYAFKQVLETGEVLLSDATVRRGPHPARPSKHAQNA